ncbi:septum formation initiator family protein [Paenibacillus chartarius]|uniref:Septum formation initiator family protein n=1 Tax=Paenibacillus chartarius TaxID=747481 RepID=A0ABV6DNC0_9BACL
MAAYIQGNLARKPKQDTVQKLKVKETRKVVVRTKSLPTQEKLLYLFTVAVLVIASVVILWRYAQIYQMNAAILQVQQEIKQMQAENMALKQQIDKLQSPDRLKEEAVARGFVPVDESVQPQQQSASKTANAQKSQPAKTTAAAKDGTKKAVAQR